MKNIGVLNYGMGNLRSIQNSFAKMGAKTTVVANAIEFDTYDALVLPGVGAFDKAMENLNELGFVDALNMYRLSGRPILGICLGMQLMCLSSEEGGKVCEGLGWFPIKVKALPTGLVYRVPHIGWNTVKPLKEKRIFEGIPDVFDVYFVHSFYAEYQKDLSCAIGLTDCGVEFSSILAEDNVLAMQFHPEKSHKIGLKLLENFICGKV